MQCPWDSFQHATVRFCEERLCSWIVEPANSWSNIFYILVGLYIVRLSLKDQKPKLSYIGICNILVGMGSTIFHGTGTFFGEFLDLSAMYLISGLMIMLVVKRLLNWDYTRAISCSFCFAVLNAGLLYYFNKLGILIFTAHVFFYLSLLWYYKKSRSPVVQWKYLLIMLGLFIFAFFSWTLDITGLWCNPHNHFINGHSIWHIVNGFCLYWLYRFESES